MIWFRVNPMSPTMVVIERWPYTRYAPMAPLKIPHNESLLTSIHLCSMWCDSTICIQYPIFQRCWFQPIAVVEESRDVHFSRTLHSRHGVLTFVKSRRMVGTYCVRAIETPVEIPENERGSGVCVNLVARFSFECCLNAIRANAYREPNKHWKLQKWNDPPPLQYGSVTLLMLFERETQEKISG